ncbi:ABC transporter permease [Microlunatus flavus]|uniref:Transport permease protein n=1 Tax=Microlunatus flavus TaxID=1036181 RepID=A0A1H9FP97_9ACTN|nr:ABC transporter permease [Microlunatus flavus]SEQ39313.1 ABC-2 type transport system permease protein [Microlunatus flavus]
MTTSLAPHLPAARRSPGSYALVDAVTMLRRTLLHVVRYPGLSVFTIGAPVVVLLLSVFVFGGTLGAGLPGGSAGGRGAYLAYVVPGILALTIAGTAGGTAITVAMDMTEGVTARFRTMAISRGAVLAGHVLGGTVQALLAVVLVLGVGVLVGYRPEAGPGHWVALVGVVLLVALAVSWVGVGMGMQARSVETASNLPLLLTFLPLLGSGFVPTASLPAGMRWFAEHQPFTPVTETVRGLLLGSPAAPDLLLALAWCVVLTALGLVWSLRLYERRSLR